MRRIFIGGIALLLFGVISARGKSDRLTFVFLRMDPQEGVALLRPMIAPDIGVQLDAAVQALKPRTVLHCTAITREHPAIVDGQPAKLTELVLRCGDQEFSVKGLDFSPQAK